MREIAKRKKVLLLAPGLPYFFFFFEEFGEMQRLQVPSFVLFKNT